MDFIFVTSHCGPKDHGWKVTEKEKNSSNLKIGGGEREGGLQVWQVAVLPRILLRAQEFEVNLGSIVRPYLLNKITQKVSHLRDDYQMNKCTFRIDKSLTLGNVKVESSWLSVLKNTNLWVKEKQICSNLTIIFVKNKQNQSLCCRFYVACQLLP